MAITAYEKEIDWVPDPQYVNDPQQALEYYGWRLGTTLKHALWTFYPAVAVPTQDLEVDILGNDFVKYEVDDDLQKYGFERNYSVKDTILDIEESLKQDFAVIDSLI